jgi:hypothetical protein
MQTAHIWLQPGTRLHMIVCREDHYEIWTATSSRIGDSSTWTGTYIQLYNDGCMYNVTRTEAGVEDRFKIGTIKQPQKGN